MTSECWWCLYIFSRIPLRATADSKEKRKELKEEISDIHLNKFFPSRERANHAREQKHIQADEDESLSVLTQRGP